jgi:hypothetical protein
MPVRMAGTSDGGGALLGEPSTPPVLGPPGGNGMSQPFASQQPALSQPVARSLAAIDADLHSCRAIRRHAEKELAEVRRRQEELADLEATLLITIDTRSRLVDHLLDERLRTSPAGSLQLSMAAQSRQLTRLW